MTICKSVKGVLYILWRIALTKWLYVWYCVLQNKPEVLLVHPQIKRELIEVANDYKR